jgi:hypothetical protein
MSGGPSQAPPNVRLQPRRLMIGPAAVGRMAMLAAAGRPPSLERPNLFEHSTEIAAQHAPDISVGMASAHYRTLRSHRPVAPCSHCQLGCVCYR